MNKHKIEWLMWYYHLYKEYHTHFYTPSHAGCWKIFDIGEVHFIYQRSFILSDTQYSEESLMDIITMRDTSGRPMRLGSLCKNLKYLG